MSWFTPTQISETLSLDLRTVNRMAADGHWRADEARARKRPGRGGGWEYHVTLLPADLQARMALAFAPAEEAKAIVREAAWQGFESLPAKHQEEARRRLAVLDHAEQLQAGGLGATQAMKQAAKAAGVAASSAFNWRKMVTGVRRADRLAALAPAWTNGGTQAEVHPQAWSVLKSDYLRPEAPTFSSCYRRMADAAAARGWSPIPSERALRRRLDAEVAGAVQLAARKGRDAAKALFPVQTRTVGHLHAMQHVNIDGHKFDVAVSRNGRVFRPIMVAIQDLYSRKMLAWRLDDSENKETTRLVIGDMVSTFGIPERMTSDNGRAFTSKWITGKVPNRYRFKVRDEDPEGLLVALGVQVLWTTPFSGQSKPIERAFRDLADTIARHPACAGAYMGNHVDAKPENYGSRAVPFEEFRDLVDAEIARHNARTGRNTETAAGGSFDEAFNASLAAPGTIVTRATEQQAALWLLAAEQVRADRRNGEVEILGTRYWHEALTEHAGTKLTVRFDPDHLAKPVRVYDSANRFLCEAQAIETVRFDNAAQARTHNRNRRAYVAATKEQARLHAELTADELSRIMADTEPAKPAKPAKPVAGVTRIARGNAQPKPQQETWDAADDAAFERAVFRLIPGGKEED